MNYFVVLNVGLGIFNLIPVPPLDGSKALGILMFDDENYLQGRVHNNGYIVIAILALTGVLSTVLGAVQNIVISVLWGFVRAILRI